MKTTMFVNIEAKSMKLFSQEQAHSYSQSSIIQFFIINTLNYIKFMINKSRFHD